MADLALANAMDATETLLQPVRVPGQVVVDHQVGVLQVHAFACRIGGQQHLDVLVLAELLLDTTTLVAVGAAVDLNHGLRPAQQAGDLAGQVVQRVAVFGEDDDLAAVAVRIEHQLTVLQDLRQLAPLLVVAAVVQRAGFGFQRTQGEQLGLHLREGVGGAGLLHRLVGDVLEVLRGQLVLGLVQVVRDVDRHPLAVGGAILTDPIAARDEFGLFQALFQPLATAQQRLVDGRGAGGEAALQHGQCEAHAVALLAVQLFGPVPLIAHVVRDMRIQRFLGRRQVVVGGVGQSRREQLGAVELEQLFLHQAPHQVGHVHARGALAELAVEAVAIQQRHEQLEVLFLAVVRRRSHQQEVAGDRAEQFGQLVALGLLDLAAGEAGRALVCLVDDDQVPVRRAQLLLQVVVACQLVQARDHPVGLGEGVAIGRQFLLLTTEQRELQTELVAQFVLPLPGQRARRHHQDALRVGAHDQFADQQASHDGLACTGVIGQHEPQRLARQHCFVDRGDLMRQRLHVRGVDGHHRVEQVGEADAQRFGCQLERFAVSGEGPWTGGGGLGQGRFVVAEQHPLADDPSRGPEHEGDGILPTGRYGHDFHGPSGIHP